MTTLHDVAALDLGGPGTALPATRPQAPVPSAAVTPTQMLAMAVERGAPMEMLEKLVALYERFEATLARRAFDEAVSIAKAEIPPVGRRSRGHNNKLYADFATIAKVVDPIISKHGLSYRFRSKQDDRIHVTCVLSHRAGHSEETTLSGPPDKTGNKNDIQAIGSTLTYLQRYSLIQALGLAATDDDDGRAGGATDSDPPITAEQKARLVTLMREAEADTSAFLERMKVATLDEMPQSMFSAGVHVLETRKKNLAAKRAAQ